MKDDDWKAAVEEYAKDFPLTPAQKIHKLIRTTKNEELKLLLIEVRQESELEAKIQMIAPWYDGSKRSEHRLAAMLARRFGQKWWLELRKENAIESLLGLIDDAWHAEVIEPHLDTSLDKAASVEMKLSEIQRTIEDANHAKPAKATLEKLIGKPRVTKGKQQTGYWVWREVYPVLAKKYTDLPLNPKKTD